MASTVTPAFSSKLGDFGYQFDDRGGVNYYRGNQAITNKQYNSALTLAGNIGQRSDVLEAQAARQYTPSAAATGPDYASQYAAELKRQNDLIARQLAATPKLPYYDTGAASARALSAATASQTPLYVQKLNDYLAKLNIQRQSQQRATDQTIQDAQDQLQQNLQDTTLQRTRTGEDVAAKIGDANYQQGQYQDVSGTQFDEARRALQEGIAANGLAESGLGSQKLDSQQQAQGQESNDKARQFQVARDNANLFKTRTFEDLLTQDTRSTAQSDKVKTRAKLDLEDYLKESQVDEGLNRTAIELERQAAILNSQGQYEKNYARDFVAQLQKSGARPQDIALAAQVYGV